LQPQSLLKEKGIAPDQRIFPITYNAARVMVSKAGKMVGVNLFISRNQSQFFLGGLNFVCSL
jgi:hypothetical protein